MWRSGWYERDQGSVLLVAYEKTSMELNLAHSIIYGLHDLLCSHEIRLAPKLLPQAMDYVC
jgi:hypothetical protein